MPGYSVRLDPWAAEYEGALQLLEMEEEALGAVDLAVESAEWRAIRPAPAAAPPVIAFVDGVRRVEHRLLVESGERTLFVLLG
jgi:hypothetical protein